MAQTKRKRSRKHRGTQAGTVEARGRTGKPPATKAEARKVASERRANRLDRPPTWRGALNRAVISAAIFAVAVVLLFRRPVVSALILGVAMVLLYLPLSYYTDRFLYNRRRRRNQQAGR
jgi:Flp pilus assembly protein TadB